MYAYWLLMSTVWLVLMTSIFEYLLVVQTLLKILERLKTSRSSQMVSLDDTVYLLSFNVLPMARELMLEIELNPRIIGITSMSV